MAIESIIRQDDTWIAVDPIVGCAKDCQYCFLQTYGATPKKGEVLTNQDEAINKLISSRTYRTDSPIMLASETDAFMNKDNISYYSEFLKKYDQRAIGNPIAMVTKCHVPDDFIDLVRGLDNTRVLFYLSYSGLPKAIEPTTNVERLRDNFPRLTGAGLDVIHYWRPFLPQNSSPEKLNAVINHAAQSAKCSIAVGLKVNEGIFQRVKKYWPELENEKLDYQSISDIWPVGVRQYIDEYTKLKHSNYPLFWSNSCALAYVLNKPDFNGVHKTEACLKAHCPDSQRQLCDSMSVNYHPSQSELNDAMAHLGVNTTAEIDTMNRQIVVHDQLEHGDTIYLRQKLSYPVVSDQGIRSKNEWGGAVIGRVAKEVPYNSKNFDIDRIWNQSINIREMFREVERLKWGAEEYGAELTVQVGHLSDIVLRQEHKLNKLTNEQNKDVLADEVSDVILNIFSIADHYKLNIPDELKKIFRTGRYEILDGIHLYNIIKEQMSSSSITPIRIVGDISRLSGELQAAIYNVEDGHILSSDLSPKLISIFLHTLKISDHYNVNIDQAFNKMMAESNVFINKHRNSNN